MSNSDPQESSIEVQSDFTDLYSKGQKELLIGLVKTPCKISGFSQPTVDYIVALIKVNMENSYFKEPKGIFTMLCGFSMGDISAASGSELILRISEITTYLALSVNNLFEVIRWYLRFRDDSLTDTTE